MKTIFWNVDTQYDFMRPDGKLYVKGAEEIEGNLARITALAERKNIIVVSTADWHDEFTKEISSNPDFINTFPPHCMQDTEGAQYIPATQPNDPTFVDWRRKSANPYQIQRHRNLVLLKDDFDVFIGNPDTEEVIDLLSPDRAIVYGVATNVCVDYAVRGLRKRGIETFVVADAIKELPNIPVEPVYDAWRKDGVKFTTTSDLETMLDE